MIYLDTGCLVKLYYPEPDSAQIIAHVRGRVICFTPLHELELVNALQLKIFFHSGTTEQASAARALVQADLNSGVLSHNFADWIEVFRQAVSLAGQYTHLIGCRSLDVLHCAAAKVVEAEGFVSTDIRQKKLALAMGLKLLTV